MPPSPDELVCVAVETWLDRPHDVAAYGAMVSAVAARRQAVGEGARVQRSTAGRHRSPGPVDDAHLVVRLPREPPDDATRRRPAVLPPDRRPTGGGGAPAEEPGRTRGRHRRAVLPIV